MMITGTELRLAVKTLVASISSRYGDRQTLVVIRSQTAANSLVHPPPVMPSRVLMNGLNRLDSFEILRRKVDWFDLF